MPAANENNCCLDNCNLAALKATAQLQDGDVVYASFHNRVYEVPFYVAVDNQSRSVVVGVRGTLSLKDALTDMTAKTQSIPSSAALMDAWTAHKGILLAASYVVKQLQDRHILQETLAAHPHYDLVITGNINISLKGYYR